MQTLDLPEFSHLRRLPLTKLRPTRRGAGSLSSSHTSVREAPKSCLGFAGGGVGPQLSWPVQGPLLAVFWPESKGEVTSDVVVINSLYLSPFPFHSLCVAMVRRGRNRVIW